MSDVDPASIDELRSRFRGEILGSFDPGYDEARAVWNATVDKRPSVIARCADTEDVVASVAFARRSGLEIAVARVSEDETAFGHRDAQVDFLALARWTDPSEDEDHIAPCRANWEALAPFADAGVYVNNLGSEDRAREAYGEEKYRRLVALKDRVDPENVFHLNANILPSLAT